MPLEHKMILSASGWRKVFAESGIESDGSKRIGSQNKALCFLAAESFLEWLMAKSKKKSLRVAVASDTRPTGKECSQAVLKALALKKAKAFYVGAAAAPEIMAYAKAFDAFIYISASHNPIGHNGIKFGLNDGGVLSGAQNSEVKGIFEKKLLEAKSAQELLKKADKADISKILLQKEKNKKAALLAYKKFSRLVISAQKNVQEQNKFFKGLKAAIKERGVHVCADFNGSARCLSVDKDFFEENAVRFKAMNSKAGRIAHEIIPEPENLVHVAALAEKIGPKAKGPVLGYMPDCDGDRGNLVYYSAKEKKAKILKAQEVFALSVLAELSYSLWLSKKNKAKAAKMAVAVNCPTSMRIEEIAGALGAKVFRAEVGEANVVNLAREKRNQGYEVRILGEGSNGGTITYPAAVRDPLNTVFALIKLLSLKGILEPWEKSQGLDFGQKPSLDDILDSLPKYTTTGVSERRAILKIKTKDHALLKKNFQIVFERSFKSGAEGLVKKYGISSWKCALTNGTKEKLGAQDFSKSGKGGLKILFFEKSKKPSAYIWMRGSGTEPVFRILCDVKGKDEKKEKDLLAWETKMLAQADKMR